MTYKIERVVTQQPHVEYVTTEVTYNAIEQDTILDPLDTDTLVKLYRGFKYDYITCVRSTAPAVTVANEQAIQDLLILIEGRDDEGSGTGLIEILDEGVQVGTVSSINFAGGSVTTTLDEDDETGKTALVTITGNAQSISKLIIENPELVYDNLLEVYTAPVVLTDPITDVYISTNNEWHGSGGEGGELSDSTIIVVSMILENYASGDIVRVSLSSNYGTNPVIFRFPNRTLLANIGYKSLSSACKVLPVV